MLIHWVLSFVYIQLFTKIPKPTQNFKEKTIIIIGANTGLGLGVAKHIVRLYASRGILACWDVKKGEDAKRAIEVSTSCPSDVLEVWQPELASYASVKQTASKANTPSRLEVLLENAGLATGEFRWVENNASQIAINAVSTILLGLLLLPKMKATTRDFGDTRHLTVVASGLHNAANFQERNSKNIFDELSNKEKAVMSDR